MPEMTRTIQRHASHQEEGTNTYITYLRVLHTWDTAKTCTYTHHISKKALTPNIPKGTKGTTYMGHS